MSEPANYPEWASAPAGGDLIEPVPSKKASGWRKVSGIPEKPPYQQFNWWQNNVYLWVKHLKEEAVNFTGEKTFSDGIKTPSITEKTAGAGVTMNSPTYGFGVIPVGGIIAMGNVQAWALPAADAVKDGYALCNGNTFAALGAGNYNAALTGNRPTLNDSRFLMGSTAVGSTGGQNSITLAANNIPTLYNSAVAVSGTTNIAHSHSLGTTNVALASGATNTTGDHNHGQSGAKVGNSVAQEAAAGATGRFAFNDAYSQNFATQGNHSHSVTGTTNIDHSHTLGTTNVALASGTTATITVGTASPAALENRPLYFSGVYLMRVK
jgi:hypothetical protein